MENAKHAAQERPIAKRLVTFVTAVAACVALAAGGTLAYFSAEGKAHNVITTGGVDIVLVETMVDGKNADGTDRIVPFEDQTGVMPGQAVSKIVTVENTGASTAWVRVKVEKAISMAPGVNATPDLDLVKTDFDRVNPTTDSWEERGGWYYYKHPLSPATGTASATTHLFESVTFDATMGNDYQSCAATVTVTAQAVQYDNNGDKPGQTVFDAAGWPEE